MRFVPATVDTRHPLVASRTKRLLDVSGGLVLLVVLALTLP
ncbi:hypothetical protein [Ornithinimicrobium sp. W1665]